MPRVEQGGGEVDEAAGASHGFDKVEDEVRLDSVERRIERLEIQRAGVHLDAVTEPHQRPADGVNLLQHILFVGRGIGLDGLMENPYAHRVFHGGLRPQPNECTSQGHRKHRKTQRPQRNT